MVMQIAATYEFALTAAPLALLQARTAPATWNAAQEMFAAQPNFWRALLRAMYELTQEDFEVAGVSEIGIWRGIRDVPRSGSPAWLSRGEWRRGRSLHLMMQPLSSFTSEEVIASGFAGKTSAKSKAMSIVLRATIPVGRVLSSGRTGFGLLREHEFVVLATPGNVQAIVR